jgi:hypothetical protein
MACVGRRSRRRSSDQQPAPARRGASRIARVHVDDETWSDFRQAIGHRSVAEVLGRYVELEVARAQRDRLKDAEITDRELADVLDRAAAMTRTLQSLTLRLEARLPDRS